MNQFKTKNFTKTSEFDKMKSDSNNQNMPDNSFKIPEEPNEQKRLKLLTGAYRLEKVDKNTLKNHANLPKKTPDDYHDINKLSVTEGARRIDEALGPKTDFSISNYENNYEKMNNEEKSMLTYKMQKEFNKLGYTDKYGQKLKEDGILGDKTKSAYENYIQKNRDMYNSVIENREQVKNNDFSILSDKNGKPVYFASINTSLQDTGLSSYKEIPYVAENGPRKKSTPQFTQPYKPSYTSQNKKEPVLKGDYEIKAGESKKEPILKGNFEYKPYYDYAKEKKNEIIDGFKKYIFKVAPIVSKSACSMAGYGNIPNDVQKSIWLTGAVVYLSKEKNCNISASMLIHSLKKNPSKLKYGDDSELAIAVKKSGEFKNALEEYVTNTTKTQFSGVTLSVPRFSENHDLYLSINHASFVIDGYKDSDGSWNITVKMTDTYDFTEIMFPDLNKSNMHNIGVIANDFALYSQLSGAITPYEIEVNFKTKVE